MSISKFPCSPMVRDFFDETGVPIMYIDLNMQMLKGARELFKSLDSFHAITVAAYDIMGRISDVPLTTKYYHQEPESTANFDGLFGLAYQSGSIGYCFGEQKDHMSTPLIPTNERREELAKEGAPIIEEIVRRLDMKKIVADMRSLHEFELGVMERYPWIPAASHKNI